MRRFGWKLLALLVGVHVWGTGSGVALAGQLWLQDGRILEGKMGGPIPGLAEVPQSPNPEGMGPRQSIVFVDDDLRRTFVSNSRRIIDRYVQDDSTEILEKFRTRNRPMRAGPTITSVGPFVPVGPFDEYGRRRVKMRTVRGTIDIIQCITEITPLWTKVEGHDHVWDMRINTSNIPRNELADILAKLTERDDVEGRQKIARFYLQGERYEEAHRALDGILVDSPNQPELRERLEPIMQAIRQQSARHLLGELKLRQAAGQHDLVRDKLGTFPSEGVAGNILEEVRELIGDYESQETERKRLLERFDELLGQIEDEATRQRIEPIRDEIHTELGANTEGRLAAFRLMLDDDSLLADEKLSLAVSGWLLGGDSSTVKLPVSLSVFEVRALVREYLNAQNVMTRAQIFERFRSEEGATPRLVAKLLAQMKPPVDAPAPVPAPVPEKPAAASPVKTLELRGGEKPPSVNLRPPAGRPPDGKEKGVPAGSYSPTLSGETEAAPVGENSGYYELEVAGLPGTPAVEYLVQLPPEYDPYRRYPTIVTLHGAGSTPTLQVNWWAGDWTPDGQRTGQAMRHGYIVVAPRWAAEHQKEYRYSLQEHVAVLNSLRDACRRFAVDTDRVYLSGHSIGGDAAWDLGLAHPDLWAGVIPIVAQSGKYCARYWKNAKLVPFYFVAGELDGTKTATNARDLDRLLEGGYNVTVVEYRGRGHEHFSDEIQRLFDWMGRFQRDFYPKEFSASTMRRWDNFFWWVELDAMPPRAMVDPVDWPPPRGTQPVITEASVTAKNGIRIRTGAGSVRVLLSPKTLDLNKRVNIVVNGRRVNPASQFLEPDLETLLEDVRTRGDRQHPFWVKVESDTGRVGGDR